LSVVIGFKFVLTCITFYVICSKGCFSFE